jgi:hypothetical protein
MFKILHIRLEHAKLEDEDDSSIDNYKMKKKTEKSQTQPIKKKSVPVFFSFSACKVENIYLPPLFFLLSNFKILNAPRAFVQF